MDKKFLNENNLAKAQSKFQKLYEYTFIGNTDICNEDDEENSDSLVGDGQPENSNDIVDDKTIDNKTIDQNDGGVEGFNPQDSDDDNGLGDFKSDDDEVIDVDDLTKAQDEIKGDVENLGGNLGNVSSKLDNLMKYMSKVETYLKQKDNKIDLLRAEIEKRNPTPIEKLNNQASLSYPFNIKPQDYWDDKEEVSNYRVTNGDENGEKQGQYVITQKDIDGSVNWKEIADSFKKNKNLNQNLRDIFK